MERQGNQSTQDLAEPVTEETIMSFTVGDYRAALGGIGLSFSDLELKTALDIKQHFALAFMRGVAVVGQGVSAERAVLANADRTIKLGPILERSVEAGLALAIEEIASGQEDMESYENRNEWLLTEIVPRVVPAGDDDIENLLPDTPDLLAYCIPLDELWMKRVSLGWLVGEAAYRAVADAVEARLAERGGATADWLAADTTEGGSYLG